MDLGDLFRAILPFIIMLLAIMGSTKKKRPQPQQDHHEIDPGEGSLAGPTRLERPQATPAGERVSPDPFSRREAANRPAWVEELEQELAQGRRDGTNADPFGNRERTLRRVDQALEVEAPPRRNDEHRTQPTVSEHRTQAHGNVHRTQPQVSEHRTQRQASEHRTQRPAAASRPRGRPVAQGLDTNLPKLETPDLGKLPTPPVGLGATKAGQSSPSRSTMQRPSRSNAHKRLSSLMRSHDGIRTALLARELLGAPHALRDRKDLPGS